MDARMSDVGVSGYGPLWYVLRLASGRLCGRSRPETLRNGLSAANFFLLETGLAATIISHPAHQGGRSRVSGDDVPEGPGDPGRQGLLQTCGNRSLAEFV